MNRMVTLDEALEIIKGSLKHIDSEIVAVMQSQGRVLAQDVVSSINIPAFNKSAMDGFAIRQEDLPGPFTIIEEIPAGNFPIRKVEPGSCAKIMTGAPIPQGANMVIMKEFVEYVGESTVLYTKDRSNENICFKGEDIQTGQVVLKRGTFIKSEHIAVLSSVGLASIEVYSLPKIAVVATGSELVEPGHELEEGQIYNSNGHQLTARMTQLGFPVEYMGIVEDDYEKMLKVFSNLKENFDLTLLSGGVSVGDYDLVPQVLKVLDFDIRLETIATKPGKHTLFAVNEEHYVLGLPGNPVSTYVQFEVCGKALVYGLMGHDYEPVRITSIIGEVYERKKDDRFELLPVALDHEGKVKLLKYNGSAHIHAITNANAMMEIPIGTKKIKEGSKVYVRPL